MSTISSVASSIAADIETEQTQKRKEISNCEFRIANLDCRIADREIRNSKSELSGLSFWETAQAAERYRIMLRK